MCICYFVTKVMKLEVMTKKYRQKDADALIVVICRNHLIAYLRIEKLQLSKGGNEYEASLSFRLLAEKYLSKAVMLRFLFVNLQFLSEMRSTRK